MKQIRGQLQHKCYYDGYNCRDINVGDQFAKCSFKTDVAYDYAQWSEAKSLSEKCLWQSLTISDT